MSKPNALEIELHHFAAHVARLIENRDRAPEAAKELLQRVLQRTNGGVGSAVARFEQIHLGGRMLEMALKERDMSAAYDWITWSISASMKTDQVRDVDPGRLQSVAADEVLSTIELVRVTLAWWLADFYYYARVMSALREVAIALFDVAMNVFAAECSGNLDERGASLGAMLLGWAVKVEAPQARALTEMLEKLVEMPINADAKAILLVCLGTRSGRFSSNPTQYWVEKALEQPNLAPEQRLQMLVNTFSACRTQENFQKALDQVDVAQGRVSLRRARLSSGRRELDAYADVSLILFAACIEEARLDRLFDAIEHWYRLPSAERDSPGDVVAIAPFSLCGFVAVCGKRMARLDREGQELLEKLSNTYDQFAGTTTTVHGQVVDAPHVPDRLGIGDEDVGPRVESLLREAYRVEDVKEIAGDARVQLMVPTRSYPVQAVQLRSTGRTWPVSASLERAKPDCSIRRAVLWSGAGTLTEEMEIEFVCEILRRSDVAVSVHAPKKCAVEEFVAAYAAAEVDLFWVSSHNEFDHFAPLEVRLQISREGQFVRLDDLIDAAPRAETRRLLVLNVCDAGRFAEIGALPRIGMAPSLACANQAVISHLWPVHGYAAAAFGACLAVALGEKRPHFEAFATALMKLREPPATIAGYIDGALGESGQLAERLRAQTVDFGKLFFSGSPAFYQ